MPSIFKMHPLHPTDKGRQEVQTETFRHRCAQIALSARAQELPFEALEARLRYLAATTLCPRLARGTEDEFLAFVRAHWDAVEGAWRMSVAPVMRRIDADFSGLMKEFGITLLRRSEFF
jgi:hypothetical protein